MSMIILIMFKSACHYWKNRKQMINQLILKQYLDPPLETIISHIPIEENVKISNSLHQIERRENNLDKINRAIEERTKLLDELTDSKYHYYAN